MPSTTSPFRVLQFSAIFVALAPDVVAADAATQLDRILVRSAQVREVDTFEIPASIRSVSVDGRNARPEVELSELLDAVPGILARDRQNLAQDTQISIRGFGARSTFGVRGVRLYADGIPATLPDGQGQVSHFSVAGAERVEVLRGPFSALHGNSSGGVVQLWSADGVPGGEGLLRTSVGRDRSRSFSLRYGDAGQRYGYRVAATRFDTDGYRDHSSARRESVNARLRFEPGADTRLVVVLNHLDAPDTQDPLGLTAAELAFDRRAATAAAELFDTRKSVAQDQLGATLEHDFERGHGLRLAAYAGERGVEQFLSLPVGAQAAPLNSGGVIDLDNRYHGGDLRWSWNGTLAGRNSEFAAGVASERLRQHRRGFENFVGPQLGVRGALRRDEVNRVGSDDHYAQLWWEAAPRWSILAGARSSRVHFDSRDDYVTAGNPDDSGRVVFRETSPVAGVGWTVKEGLRLHLSAGRGFETPTFNELAYRADGQSGLAFDLRPAVSDNFELGAKWRSSGNSWWELTLFRADTEDELAVARNVAGRSSFRNAGRARREGLELGAGARWARDWQLEVALTVLDARFRDGFASCSGAGCATPNLIVDAGSRIPGVPRRHGYARLQWRPDIWELAVETEAVGAVTVSDAGTNSSPGYALLALELARDWALASGSLRGFARVDNALDKAYVGSVIVNEGNSRHFEPGPGRGLLLGLQWSWH